MKMKIILAASLLAIALGTITASANEVGGFTPMNGSQEPEGTFMKAAFGGCYAETSCAYNGVIIGKAWCYVNGPNCSWFVQPWNYVTCTGFNNAGFWGTWVYACPR